MTTRRAFLQSAALAAPALLGGVAALPPRPKPSNRVSVAIIGCGYQAVYGNLNSFLLDPRVQVTMACGSCRSGKRAYFRLCRAP